MMNHPLYFLTCKFVLAIYSAGLMPSTLWAIGPPLFLQGLAQGLLLTPLVMYLLSGMPVNLASSSSLTGTAIRFWTTNIGFATMQNVSYWLNKEHYPLFKPSKSILRKMGFKRTVIIG